MRAHPVSDEAQSQKPSSGLALLLMLWWLFSIVDSALAQAQIQLLGDRVPIGGWALDALLLLALLILVLRNGLPTVPRSIAWTWGLFSAYLALELVFLAARRQTPALAMITDFYRYYFYLLLLPAAYLCAHRIDERRLSRWLLCCFVPLAWLGLQQHFGGDAMLPTQSGDGRFQIFAWGFQGDIRAFSLFNSGWSFGHFGALMAALVLCAWRLRPARIPAALWFGLFTLALVAVYASHTRTAFLVAAATVFAVPFALRMRATGQRGAMVLLPLLFAFAGWLVAVGAGWLVKSLDLGNETLFSQGSLNARFDAWDYYGGRWLSGTWAEVMFGTGLGQHDSGALYSESTVLIDNMFIAIGLQAGLVGVLLWTACMWAIWLSMLTLAEARDSPLHWALAAVWATWPLSLMFCASSNFYGLLAVIAVMAGHWGHADETLFSDDPGGNEMPEHTLGDRFVARHTRVGVVRQE